VSTGSADAITVAVGQENLLLQTYKVTLPPAHNRNTNLMPGSRDVTSTIILNSLQPALLQDHVPISISGDGNCMFRALSKALYGTENMHTLLRLLTSLEIACFLPDYENLLALADSQISVPDYTECLQTVCELGSATELIHLYAASTVIGKPIQSVFPLRNSHFSPWDRLVVGRNLTHQATNIKLLWSSASVPQDMQTFSPNHFVLLHSIDNASQIQPIPSMLNTCSAPTHKHTANAKRRPPISSRGRPKKKPHRTSTTDAVEIAATEPAGDNTTHEEPEAVAEEQ